MFLFCSYHAMSTRQATDPSLLIPPVPLVIRFTPARSGARPARRAMRDFTAFLALAWAAAEIALWVTGV